MSDNSLLNSSLFRNVKKGTRFNSLFSATNCTPKFLGKGDTSFGVQKMKKWVLDTHNQIDTEKAIQLFGSTSTEKTVSNIKKFVFDHFQYKADNLKQNLRSPNCSWQQRYEGIDCKSYSIISSVLLYKNNLKHYIRRIKQPNFSPDNYTHVYVIVPINQTTADLKEGYYVIDGTLSYDSEPTFSKKDDVFMNNDLEYYGLQGVSSNKALSKNNKILQKKYFLNTISGRVSAENISKIEDYINQLISSNKTPYYSKIKGGYNVSGLEIYLKAGLNGSDDSFFNNLLNEGKKLINVQEKEEGKIKGEDIQKIFTSIGKFFGHISCWGGSAYDGETVDRIGKQINSYYAGEIYKINQIVASFPTQNYAQASNNLSEILGKFFYVSDWSGLAYYYKKHSKSWNKCSEEGIQNLKHVNWYYEKTVYPLLIKWVEQYFNVTRLADKNITAQHDYISKEIGFEGTNFTPSKWKYDTELYAVPVYSFTPKNGNYSIKQFEFTAPLIAESKTRGIVNIDGFINSLKNEIAQVKDVVKTVGNNGSGNTGNTGNTGNSQLTNQTANTSGISKSLIGGVVAVGVSYALYNLMNKDSKTSTKK